MFLCNLKLDHNQINVKPLKGFFLHISLSAKFCWENRVNKVSSVI